MHDLFRRIRGFIAGTALSSRVRQSSLFFVFLRARVCAVAKALPREGGCFILRIDEKFDS